MPNETSGKEMEKVRGSAGSALDCLLMPFAVHRNISRKAAGLAGAFLLVGAFDTVLLQNLARQGIFSGSAGTAAVRVLAAAGWAFLTGLLDVVCVMWPIADFARFLARRRERFISGGIHVILMKSYALSHLLFIIPMAMLIYNPVDLNSTPQAWSAGVKIEFAVLASILRLFPFVRLGIVFRTLGVRSRLDMFPRLLVVAAMYFWLQVVGEMTVRVGLIGLGWILAIG
jgi:hypothetical protein